MKGFCHLHLHTQYSLLDGVNKLPDILKVAKERNQNAIAMTDHGNLHGAIEFYSEAKKIGIKPIIGCELYVTPGSRFEKKMERHGGEGINHLTALAITNEGYQNLCALSTLGYREGFYFKPRVDHEILSRYSKGLVILSGCLASELSQYVLEDDLKRAEKLLDFYLDTFGDRFYLEVQPHKIPEQQKLNSFCVETGKRRGIPIVATTDCHYPNIDDHYAQEVLMCISTQKTIQDPTRLRHVGFTLHLKTENEMENELGQDWWVGDALRASGEIANRVDLNFDFSKHFMPVFEVPPPKTPDELMAELSREGLKKKLSLFSLSQQEEAPYWERLEEEIKLITQMGFSGYFLVVSDFIVWAKENGIPVGPGRGSVAGSLVAYALRITDVDPLKHRLLFERFLNPERVSLPDIDVDFCINGRDRVIEYVVQKYGKDKVAQIATFGTLKAKAAIKDVGRALGLSYAETDKVAQWIPAPRQGFDYSLTDSLSMEPKLLEYSKKEGKELISLALKLEGLTRHSSTHAAGVVIGDRPLIEMLPLMVDKEGREVTQYSMSYVEKIGLVKFDFLGLKTLTVIQTALDLIKSSRGVTIDLETLFLEDPKTYTLLSAGNTTGVFQLESSGITEMVQKLKPNCFDDLVAILALYRPGPLDSGMADHYIERKHGRAKVEYIHPLMEKSLSDTYGIMLYQEQIMQLARELAGYSLGEADLLRKAMGKKIPEEMAKQKVRFVTGCIERGITERAAGEIFSQMETFARYGFNRSHSVAYAMVSYQTAYLKAHYPVEFMAALMSHEGGDTDKILKDLNECRKQNMEILPPDVNESSSSFSVAGNSIRYGLSAVKGIGEKAVELIILEREAKGKFKSIDDFISRVDSLNRRVVESLIKCGAFDGTGESRRGMLEALDGLLKKSKSKDHGQLSLFGSPPKRETPEWPINQKLSFEREALGFYISGHPLEKFRPELKKLGVISTEDIKTSSSSIRIAGVVTQLKLKNTKKGDRYASFLLEDWLGAIEALVWPDVYRSVANILVADEPVIVSARSEVTEERRNLIVETIESLISIRDRTARYGLLNLSIDDDLESHRERLVNILEKHKGNCPLKVRIDVEGRFLSLVLKDKRDAPISVSPSETLCEEVELVFGRPVLSFV